VRALQAAIEADVAAGGKPIAVIATAGTVNTGAVDPLEPIAAVSFALRACFVNHRTTDSDVAEIVPEVLAAARDVL
jgi:glutamate/tyrosine decarboxylase-like PLP-dependent enzyme